MVAPRPHKIMYSIHAWIYGIPLNKKALAALSKHLKIDLEEECAPITLAPDIVYETRYSGAGDETPAFVGFELAETDECTSYLKFDFAKRTVNADKEAAQSLQPTPEQEKAINDWHDALPLTVQRALPDPGLYLIFYTS